MALAINSREEGLFGVSASEAELQEENLGLQDVGVEWSTRDWIKRVVSRSAESSSHPDEDVAEDIALAELSATAIRFLDDHQGTRSKQLRWKGDPAKDLAIWSAYFVVSRELGRQEWEADDWAAWLAEAKHPSELASLLVEVKQNAADIPLVEPPSLTEDHSVIPGTKQPADRVSSRNPEDAPQKDSFLLTLGAALVSTAGVGGSIAGAGVAYLYEAGPHYLFWATIGIAAFGACVSSWDRFGRLK